MPLGNPTLGGQPLLAGFDPSINELGQVAYIGNFGKQSGVVFQGNVLVSTLDTIQGAPISWIPSLMLNNNGQVVASARSGDIAGIFLNDQLAVAPGDIIDSFKMRDLGLWPAINDSGTIAFVNQSEDGRGVFTIDHKIAAEGDTIDGYRLQFIDNGVAINNAGEVVFLAGFSDGYGLFSEHKLLVRTGDIIDGHTITFISERAAITMRARSHLLHNTTMAGLASSRRTS